MAVDYAVRVRMLLHNLEAKIGLDNLSGRQRDLLCAFVGLARNGNGAVRSEDLRRHPLAAPMTHPTYHRTLRALLEADLIQSDPRTGKGNYLLHAPSLDRIRSLPAAHLQDEAGVHHA